MLSSPRNQSFGFLGMGVGVGVGGTCSKVMPFVSLYVVVYVALGDTVHPCACAASMTGFTKRALVKQKQS